MKSFLLAFACLASFNVQALEYEKQFENDQMCVGKVTLQPQDEIGLHRDAHTQVVVALKGGTIRRTHADGRVTEVVFPTGVAVVREPDPENELHTSVNSSPEPVELIVIQLKDSSPAMPKADGNSHDISVNVKINCPPSAAYQAFLKSIPPAGNYSSNFAEWKSSFVNNMHQLVQLVESEKLSYSRWSVETHDFTVDNSVQEVVKLRQPFIS